MEVDKDGAKRNIGGGKGNRKGTPQGGVISPLLSNLFLHLLDRLWEKRGLQQRIGARMVRYADAGFEPHVFQGVSDIGLAVSSG